MKTHGLRNSTLSALMPYNLSQISNATNGIEPPRGYVSIKASKDGLYTGDLTDLPQRSGCCGKCR
ncbi:hypothetical protein ACLBOM_14215 [Escherichia coli]